MAISGQELQDAPVNRADMEKELQDRFRVGAADGHDVVMAIAARDRAPLTFAVSNNGIVFDDALTADVTFTFDSADTAMGIIRGTIDPIGAFMEGRFRSDGHLILAFVMMAVFR